MSRTHNDKPWEVRFPEERWEYEYTEDNYVFRLKKSGVKTKKKRSYHPPFWMTTPMWWIREFMNRPQRAKGAMWEKATIKLDIESLEDVDHPNVSRKPHLYYW